MMLSKFKSFLFTKKKDCGLECVVPPIPAVHEFVGPVRIVLVDTTTCTYTCRRLVAALVAVAYFLMGAVTTTVLYFVMVSEKSLYVQLHILFGTFAVSLILFTGSDGLLCNKHEVTRYKMLIDQKEIVHVIGNGLRFQKYSDDVFTQLFTCSSQNKIYDLYEEVRQYLI